MAKVQRMLKTGRNPDGFVGRPAQALTGRPHRGQKFPRNNVPQRGQGHPMALGDGGAAMVAGAPHRGQKRPSKNVPQRAHCISSPTRGTRYLTLRDRARRALSSFRNQVEKVNIGHAGPAALRPCDGRATCGRTD
jgi:hypothetical protein